MDNNISCHVYFTNFFIDIWNSFYLHKSIIKIYKNLFTNHNRNMICELHKVLYTNPIRPMSLQKKRCMICLRKNVSGYANIYQVATPVYNYLFPMICNNCSQKTTHCKWCVIYRRRILQT